MSGGKLELLAPARTAGVGLDAVNAGADAIYVGGPAFGARKAAGNSVEDVARLCDYAHRFGVAVFVTFNTRVQDSELAEVHRHMLECQTAGADAFIIRDPRICEWKDITRPLHASTQCAIRNVEDARRFEALGCSRIVLERQMSLEQIREIRRSVGCELEFFVHGAICVCYSGECRLSEYVNGRSADCGDCIQACRSRYDLTDSNGNVLARDKALLSLKDYRLLDRLEELADAGVCSFKIEGRLKNSSYVRNVVREYSTELDRIVSSRPDKYERASFGRVTGGFEPDSDKTFNRGYTELYIDGKRGGWASSDATKSMGEAVGRVRSIRPSGNGTVEIILDSRPDGGKAVSLANGDGFAYTVPGRGVSGFRGDVCRSRSIFCRPPEGLKPGMEVYRNVSREFEKNMDENPCRRMLPVEVDVNVDNGVFRAEARCCNGTEFSVTGDFSASDKARNPARMSEMISSQLGKSADIYDFSVGGIRLTGEMPLISAAELNAIRRRLAKGLAEAWGHRFGVRGRYPENVPVPAYPASPLMRGRYCVRYELGLCPKYQGAKPAGVLYLVNNGQKFRLDFDCARCEMTLDAV